METSNLTDSEHTVTIELASGSIAVDAVAVLGAAYEGEENRCPEEDGEQEDQGSSLTKVTIEIQQSQYINMFKKEGLDAVILPHSIDSPFIGHLEQKNEGLKFLRIDADLNSTFKEEVKDDDEEFKKTSEALTETFKKALGNVKACDYKAIRHDIIKTMSNRRDFSRYDSGAWKLTENQQEKIKRIFADYGYDDVEFDFYEEMVSFLNK